MHSHHLSMAALLRIEKTLLAEDDLLWSNDGIGDALRRQNLIAGAVGRVIDADDTATGLKPGEEVLACLMNPQLAALQRTREILVPLYAISRKPDNLDAGESAELLVHPSNVAMLVHESRSAIVMVQLLHHTQPDLDIFFVYEERPPEFNRDYPAGLYFMLPLPPRKWCQGFRAVASETQGILASKQYGLHKVQSMWTHHRHSRDGEIPAQCSRASP